MKTISSTTLLFFALASFFIAGCEGASAPRDTTPYQDDAPPKVITPDKDWTALTTLTGSGSFTSEVLEVSGDHVKALCTITSEDNKCALKCWLVESTKTLESDNISQTQILQTTTCGDSEQTFYRGNGKYFLDVEATGSWKIELFQK